MSATDQVTQVVFWAHVVGAVVLVVGSVAVNRLVGELEFEPGGIRAAPWARRALDRGVPAGGLLFAVAVAAYGFAFLDARVTALDPPASALGALENLALLVPGATIGKWTGIAGLLVFNGAILLFVLDIGYRWARERQSGK